jgi:hypothetical protein
MATPLYGMHSEGADAAVHTLVMRVVDLPLDELVVELQAGVRLIASVFPEVLTEPLVRQVIADAIAASR